MAKFAYYKTKKAALTAGKKMKKPVYKGKEGYVVGSIPQAIYRTNLKYLLSGKFKKIQK